MAEAAFVAQQTRIAFNFDLSAILAILAGILILVFPAALNYIVAAFLIIWGVIVLFNINI